MDNIKIAIERIEKVRFNRDRFLNLSGLFLSEIPIDISDMVYLFDIDLSHNYLNEVPYEIIKFDNLQYLDLSYNYIRDFEVLSGVFYSFREINISNNDFNLVPADLLGLTNVEVIFSNNPFTEKLPLEISERNDLSFVHFYLDSLKNKDDRKKLFETKLLIVGKGDVGKTTFMKTLIDPGKEFVIGKEKTTEGINIESIVWPTFLPANQPYYSISDYDNLCIKEEVPIIETRFNEYGFIEEFEELDVLYEPINDYLQNNSIFYDEIELLELKTTDRPVSFIPDAFFEKDIKINLWDFGGQEILYGTHQFFLTQRSVYIYMWDSRPDNEFEGFEYWLNIIKRLSNNSPVIVVMNKSDSGIKNIDEDYYNKEFKDILSYHIVSCCTKAGLNEVKEDIRKAICILPHISDVLPLRWNNIRENIESINKDFISYSEFKDICNFNDEEKTRYLSKYLNDLGDIVHFIDDYTLKDLVIVNPYWLTDAIYALIHSLVIQKNNGLFDAKDLSRLLDQKKYPSENYHRILLIMEKFEICFKVIGSSSLYVIPTLLKAMPENSDLKMSFIIPESLKYEIKYNFLPSGIVERLLCRLKGYIGDNEFWKYGAVFTTEHNDSLVLFNKATKTINLYVKGEFKAKIYSVITNEIRQINKDLKLNDSDYTEKWACSCISCSVSKTPYMIDKKVLDLFIYKGKKHIDCMVSTEAVLIEEILIGYKSSTNQQSLLRAFVNASSELQANKKLIVKYSENEVNTFFQILLRNHLGESYYTNEQSLKGESESRKSQGELDIVIEDNKGIMISFFEGMILKSMNSTVINKHIKKSMSQYDSNGLKEKYIGVYCKSSNFENLYNSYASHLKMKHPVVSNATIIGNEDLSKVYINGSEMKLIKTSYKRSGIQLSVYHILINLY